MTWETYLPHYSFLYKREHLLSQLRKALKHFLPQFSFTFCNSNIIQIPSSSYMRSSYYISSNSSHYFSEIKKMLEDYITSYMWGGHSEICVGYMIIKLHWESKFIFLIKSLICLKYRENYTSSNFHGTSMNFYHKKINSTDH